jgi:hypothetical protein
MGGGLETLFITWDLGIEAGAHVNGVMLVTRSRRFYPRQQYTQIATMIINTTSPPNEPPTIDISSSRLTMMF